MKKESVLTIANRYCESLKYELALLPDTVKNLKSLKFGDAPGFRLHNIACKPEMLVKYFGEQLDALGYSKQVGLIKQIGDQARLLQMNFENFRLAERDEEWGFLLEELDSFAKCFLLEELDSFAKFCESVMPVLFFI